MSESLRFHNPEYLRQPMSQLTANTLAALIDDMAHQGRPVFGHHKSGKDTDVLQAHTYLDPVSLTSIDFILQSTRGNDEPRPDYTPWCVLLWKLEEVEEDSNDLAPVILQDLQRDDNYAEVAYDIPLSEGDAFELIRKLDDSRLLDDLDPEDLQDELYGGDEEYEVSHYTRP